MFLQVAQGAANKGCVQREWVNTCATARLCVWLRLQVKRVMQVVFLPISDGSAEMPDLAVYSISGDEVFRTRLLPETSLEQVAQEVADICSAPPSDFRWVLPGGDAAVESSCPLVACGPTVSGRGGAINKHLPAKRPLGTSV